MTGKPFYRQSKGIEDTNGRIFIWAPVIERRWKGKERGAFLVGENRSRSETNAMSFKYHTSHGQIHISPRWLLNSPIFSYLSLVLYLPFVCWIIRESEKKRIEFERSNQRCHEELDFFFYFLIHKTNIASPRATSVCKYKWKLIRPARSKQYIINYRS